MERIEELLGAEDLWGLESVGYYERVMDFTPRKQRSDIAREIMLLSDLKLKISMDLLQEARVYGVGKAIN